jgi:heptosyltransferase I
MKNNKIIKNICIVRLSAIGDVCHTLAVVRAIQIQSPLTKITWIIGKVESTLIGDIKGIEFIIFDKSKSLSSYNDLYQKLKNRSFEVTLLLHASLRANIISWMIKSPNKIGYDLKRARDLQWLVSSKKIYSSKMHVLNTMFEFIKVIGLKKQDLIWDIPLSKREITFAENHYEKSKTNIVISPCSSDRYRNYRNWDLQNFQDIINYLVEKYQCHIILTGGKTQNEKIYGTHLSKMNKQSIINLIGKTSLKELAAIISLSELVICPDSGPAHIATAVNTEVIGLYASSNPNRTGPYQSEKYTINAYPTACIKYLGKKASEVKWGQRIRNPKVMTIITVDMVKERIDEFFATLKEDN